VGDIIADLRATSSGIRIPEERQLLGLTAERTSRAAIVANRALAETLGPRLRFLLSPVPDMIERYDIETAGRWLERAL
jgi:hypothetical protein